MRKLISALSAVLVSMGTLVPVETAGAAPLMIQQPVETSKVATSDPNVQTVRHRDRWERRHHRRWDRRYYRSDRRWHRRWDRPYYSRRWDRPGYYRRWDRPYYRGWDDPYYPRYYRRSGIYLQF